ncbi:MAG: hypothetical protein P1U89_00795 [Verrucomicrobiales bacterium]|nr:hypothetical protein [Verrucomicrobiales bacterium]
MEIQRYGDDRLEIVLDATHPDELKQEIDALDTVIRTWREKCESAQSCSVSLAPTVAEDLLKAAQEKVNSVDNAYGVSVDFLSEDKAENNDCEVTAGKKSHLKDLMMLAIVDGEFNAAEQKTILDIGLKMGLSERIINSIYNESILNPDQIPSVVPQDEDEKMQHLADLCRVILADGTIADWESVLIFPLAVKMGFDANDVSKMLDQMIDAESPASK